MKDLIAKFRAFSHAKKAFVVAIATLFGGLTGDYFVHTRPAAMAADHHPVNLPVRHAPGEKPLYGATGDNGEGIFIDATNHTLDLNSKKIAHVANGTVSTDGAAFGQIASTALSSFAAPTGSVNMSSQKLVSLADGTSAQDGAAFHQIGDAILTGKSTAVDALSTTNIATLSGTQTVDSISISGATQRVVLTGQTTTTQDGCYNGNASAWTRCTDLAVGSDAALRVFNVRGGTANKGTWVFTNAVGSGIVGTNDLVGLNISGSGGGSSFPPSGDLAMASHGFTGMRPGVATGEGVTYEQVSNSILSQTQGPLQYLRLVDDFQGAQSNATGAAIIVSATTFGTQGWRNSIAATGTTTSVTTNEDGNHFGIIDQAISVSAGSTATATQTIGSFTFTGGPVSVQDWLVRVPVLSDATDTYVARWGWVDAPAAPTNGGYLEYVQATSVNWRCIANAASTPTVASGGTPTAVVANTWLHLRLTWDGTTFGCQVGGVNIGTTTSGLPTVPVPRGFGIIRTAGTSTARDVLTDLYTEDMRWSSPRG